MKNELTADHRLYGIDLLRIVSMLMVCILHVLGAGGILNATTPLSAGYYTAWFLETLTYCAVNCYALISGYVGLHARHKYAGIVNLWLQVAFYSILITLLFSYIRPELVTVAVWKKAYFPVSMGQYWYFTAYFLLFFIAPLLNAGIKNLSKSSLRTSLLVFFFVLTLLPRIFERDIFNSAEGYSFLWLAYLYVVGGYIRQYGIEKEINSAFSLLVFVLSVTVSWGLKLRMDYIGNVRWNMFLISYMSPTMVIAAIALFLPFAKMHVRFGKGLIRFLAPLSFSVFLIHTHPLIFGNYLWDAFAPFATQSAPKILGIALGGALAIHLACSILDLPRHYLFKYGIGKLTAWVEKKLTKA